MNIIIDVLLWSVYTIGMKEQCISPESIGIMKNLEHVSEDLPLNINAMSMSGMERYIYEIDTAVGIETYQTTYFIKRFTKNPVYISQKIPYAQYYMDMHQVAAQTGIPVAPSKQIARDKVSILDVAEDGVFIDKALLGTLIGLYETQNMTPEYLSHPALYAFQQMRFEDVVKEAQALADLATAHNIVIPHDDPMNLLVKPDGSWRMMLLDPWLLRIYDPQRKQYVSSSRTKSKLFDTSLEPEIHNDKLMGEFISNAHVVRNMLDSIRGQKNF